MIWLMLAITAYEDGVMPAFVFTEEDCGRYTKTIILHLKQLMIVSCRRYERGTVTDDSFFFIAAGAIRRHYAFGLLMIC